MSELSSSVDKIYDEVRRMATNFEFKPDQRVNESSLSKSLGASRTPLREALNRLVAEGFLNFENGRGFFCRSLSPEKIQALYEARVAIESEALRLAVQRASDAEIEALSEHVKRGDDNYMATDSIAEMVDVDEEFHLGLVRLSRNEELERQISNINARIRYVRFIDMEIRRARTRADHVAILDALAQRNEDEAVLALRNHIGRRIEETTAAVRQAFSQLYVPN